MRDAQYTPRLFISLLAAVGTAICAPREPRAQDRQPEHVAAGTSSLTLRGALRLADEQAPDRLVAATRAAVAHADVAVAGMLTNPTVTVGSSVASAHFYTSLFIPVPLFGQRGAAEAVASALDGAARHDVEVTRLDVAMAASVAWIDLWLAEREADIAREVSTRSTRLAETADERFRAGAAPRLDSLRANAESVRLRAEADASLLAISAASARMALWVGRAPDSPLHADGDLPSRADLPPLARLLARAETHPLVNAARSRTTAAESTVRLEQRRRFPIVGFDIGANLFDPSMAHASSNTPAFGDAHVALSFEIPFFNARGPLIARARTSVSQSVSEMDAVRRRLASEIASTYADARAAQLRATALHDRVLPAAREASDLALEAYRAGRLDLQGVLAAAQSFADVQRNANRADADAGRALATLVHAVGGAW